MSPWWIIAGLVVLFLIAWLREWMGLAFLSGAAALFMALVLLVPPPDPNSPEQRLARGEVLLQSVAPDGTKLWRVRRGGRDIYFSTAGTHTTHTESCGKNCTRTVDDDVSNAT